MAYFFSMRNCLFQRFKAFVKKNGIKAEDPEGVLGDLMHEYLASF